MLLVVGVWTFFRALLFGSTAIALENHVLGDRGLGDLQAQLLELAVNPGRAPQGVGLGHPADGRSDLQGDHGGQHRSGWPEGQS